MNKWVVLGGLGLGARLIVIGFAHWVVLVLIVVHFFEGDGLLVEAWSRLHISASLLSSAPLLFGSAPARLTS
eukprot:4460359-Prymnesium_polylepis.1